MSQSAMHCPFLNRSGGRCSEFFNLVQLRHAYKFCFDNYAACDRYQQLLDERMTRRGDAPEAPYETPLVQISIAARKPRRRAVA